MNTLTQSEKQLGEVDALVGPTKGMPLHKTHMQQSQQEEFRDKNISKPENQARYTSGMMVGLSHLT